MSDQTGDEVVDLSQRDPEYVAKLLPLLRFATKWWFRSDVRDIDRISDGGALVVSNHSGGLMAMDVPVIAVAFFDHFGEGRPLFVLAHDMLFTGAAEPVFQRAGSSRPPGPTPTRCCGPGE